MSSRGYGFMILVIAVVAILVGTSLYSRGMDSDSYSYSQFQDDLKEKRVTEVYVRQNEEVPTGRLVVMREGMDEQTLYVPDVQKALEEVKAAGIERIRVEDVDRTP